MNWIWERMVYAISYEPETSPLVIIVIKGAIKVCYSINLI